MDKIGDIIGKRLNQHRLGESARAALILKGVNSFLQNRLRCSESEVNAFRVKDGTLYIGTYGAAWSQEVFLRQEELVSQVRREYGPKSVLRVIIKSLTTDPK